MLRSALNDVMTPANAAYHKTLGLQKANHLIATDARQFTHEPGC
jgi:hypothetical protein